MALALAARRWPILTEDFAYPMLQLIIGSVVAMSVYMLTSGRHNSTFVNGTGIAVVIFAQIPTAFWAMATYQHSAGVLHGRGPAGGTILILGLATRWVAGRKSP